MRAIKKDEIDIVMIFELIDEDEIKKAERRAKYIKSIKVDSKKVCHFEGM
ncbi:MAG: hypothetical protein V3U78_09935 [Thiotrichaceae bacterium]